MNRATTFDKITVAGISILLYSLVMIQIGMHHGRELERDDIVAGYDKEVLLKLQQKYDLILDTRMMSTCVACHEGIRGRK